MRSNSLAVIAAVLLVPLVGCTSGSQQSPPVSLAPSTATAAASRVPSPSQSASPSSSPTALEEPTLRVFESSRHGYRLEVPKNWQVIEYEGTWTDLDQFEPGAEVDGEDVVAPPGFATFLVTNSMPIPDDMADADWITAFDTIVQSGLPADCPAVVTSEVVGGVTARVLTQECEGDLIVGRSLTHMGRGYYFTTRSDAASDASIAILNTLVDSIEFTE